MYPQSLDQDLVLEAIGVHLDVLLHGSHHNIIISKCSSGIISPTRFEIGCEKINPLNFHVHSGKKNCTTKRTAMYNYIIMVKVKYSD